jgi:ribonuclease P protein component
MRFKNFETLKKNSEFKDVYNRKKSFANKYLIMYVLENGTDTLRLGVSVSKKVGNSIVRHRLARLIREAFRLNVDKISSGYDVVVIARASLKDQGYKETESAMIHLLRLQQLIGSENVEKDND